MENIRIRAASTSASSAITPAGELPLPTRRQLKRLIKQFGNAAEGNRRLLRLSAACAKHSAPIWLAKFPGEPWPIELVQLIAEEIERGGDVRTHVDHKMLGKLKTDLDNKLLLGEEYWPSVLAGFASWAVARDVPSHPVMNDGAASELEVDPQEWDACFFASLAIAGGAVWDGAGDPVRRRAFWQWYLDEAIPQSL